MNQHEPEATWEGCWEEAENCQAEMLDPQRARGPAGEGNAGLSHIWCSVDHWPVFPPLVSAYPEFSTQLTWAAVHSHTFLLFLKEGAGRGALPKRGRDGASLPRSRDSLPERKGQGTGNISFL